MKDRFLKGMTFIESLIALLLLSIGMISLSVLVMFSFANHKQADWKEQTHYIIFSIAERFNANHRELESIASYEVRLNKFFPGSRIRVTCEGKKCLGMITPPVREKLLKAVEFQIKGL